ncbi:hypothetical protein IJG76_01885 [Candidatus Saccharibacteria bacterium]|nr:hypothetical protein [Candidatus Saccharibacteria bacterium]
MAEFITLRKGRNLASTIIQVILNILLGIASVVATLISGSPLIGLILVILSKWRIFAVRPRFFLVNLKSNLVDLTVGLSVVMLAYFIGSTVTPAHYFLAAFYVIWLLLIKPRSGKIWPLVQSLAAILLGISAATIGGMMSADIVAVLFSIIIIYGALRHILIQNEAPENFELIALAGSVLGAEITWLCSIWGIIYTFDQSTGLMLTQSAVIIALLVSLFYSVFESVQKYDGRLRARDIAIPTLFTFAILAVIIFAFSEPYFNI